GSDGIQAAKSTGLRTFRVIVDDAGTVTPILDDLVQAAGGRLVAARELRLTFDEVFTTLVERATAERSEPVGGDAAPAGPGRGDDAAPAGSHAEANSERDVAPTGADAATAKADGETDAGHTGAAA
ncbi:MAG: hypothetical protein ABIR11_07575, partial [Candidatus Limnocylindrales bacterium]